jgi:hypothetical protein
MRTISRTAVPFMTALAIWSGVAATARARSRLDAAAVRQSEPAAATLIVFNDSGPTLVPVKLSIRDNGHTIVKVSRHQYQRVSIPPGRHVFTIGPRSKPRVEIEVAAGGSYYLLAAYKPEWSYVPLVLGRRFVLKPIDEAEAQRLWAGMTERHGDGPQAVEDDESVPLPASFHVSPAVKQTPAAGAPEQK